MPSIRDLRRHLSAAGIDHSEAKDRTALETLCIEHGLAERVEVRPSGPPCARCRKALVGEFLAIGASHFHKHCCACAVCAAPVSGEVIVGRGGALTCRPCAVKALEARAPRCGACGDPVIENGLTLDGAHFHRSCVRCYACAKALVSKDPNSTRHRAAAPRPRHPPRPPSISRRRAFVGIKKGGDGNVYCAECLEVNFGKVCDSCGAAALKYARCDATDQTLCLTCAKAPDMSCESCYRRGVEVVAGEDGGLRHCRACEATAVRGDADADAILREVMAYYGHRHGFSSFDEDEGLRALRVRLASGEEMRDLARETRHVDCACPLGVTISERRLTVTERPETRARERSETFGVRLIYARRGLPRARLASVLAHELCHAFFTLKSFRKGDEKQLPARVEEGVCELWAGLWLQDAGPADPLAATYLRLMGASKDPIYGAGYREARASYARSDSLIAFMKQIRRSKALPAA